MAKKRRITRESAKQKGEKFQKFIAERISKLLNIPCGKDELIESRGRSQSGTDIRLIGEAKELFPWSIEAKRQEKFAIPQWIEQAKANQMENTNWLLICKRNQEAPFVILDFEVFFKLMEKILKND